MKAIGKGIADVFRVTLRGFLKHDCSLHAAGLTYFSLLALVPILCLLLLLARTLGAEEFARRQIDTRLDALIVQIENGQNVLPVSTTDTEEDRARKRAATEEFAREAREISNALFDRAAKFDISTLGWIGFLMLVWTAISTLGRIETSFNAIWGVRVARPIWKRCLLYFALSVILPLLAAVALSMPVLRMIVDLLTRLSATSTYTRGVGDLAIAFLKSDSFSFTLSFGFALVAFIFFFKVMPNVRVTFRAAFVGGLFTTVALWLWLRICAIAQVGIASTSALYGSFAFLPILLAWFYVGWQIILAGANISYAIQSLHNQLLGNRHA